MAEAMVLDRAFQVILRGLMDSGHAPHYTELAKKIGCSIEEGRQVLRDLLAQPGVPGWLQPGSDYLAGFAPLTNVPTQYRVAVDGQEKWFAQ